jgi:N-acyl-D-amino-acid deacylase
MFDLLITGGRIVDGSGCPWFHGDVGVRGDRIAALGRLSHAEAALRIDAGGCVVAPGFIDAHVHGDLMLLADPHHEPAIRQGVTTYILGQDGVAMAPASPTTLAYMRRYTAGFSGNPELTERWSSVADFLACFDNRCALNVAYLIPNGNVRMEVMGLADRPSLPAEREAMGRLIRAGMEQGAVGLSSGLDYIPSRYADTDELISLCKHLAPYDGVYVTHMRRYDPDGVLGSMDEVFRIGREAGVPVHISHFNSRAELVLPKIDAGRADGIDVTYDLYCYLAGSTILGMVALPPEIQEGGVSTTLARLRDPAIRRQLRDWFARPRVPLETIRLAHVAAGVGASWQRFEGWTLEAAAREASMDVGEFVCELLIAAEMVVGCIVPHVNRGQKDVEELMRHPAMMAGSDGIFVVGFPHPRGYGCFARYLGHHARDARTWTLEEAVQHLAAHAARRFGLKDRGLIREGMAADIVVFDPATIADRSTYEDGRQLAVGMHHVVVNGQLVLHAAKRTGALPGRALRPR